MLNKNLSREEDLAEFALHWLGVFKDSLEEFCLTKLLLKLLISCLHLRNGLAQILVDLNYLFFILSSHTTSLINCLHKSFVHCLILFILFLLECNLFLQELSLMIPLRLKLLIFIDNRLINCADLFVLRFGKLFRIVLFNGFQLFLFLFLLELDLDIRLAKFTFALL